MEDKIYIVLYRSKSGGQWDTQTKGVFSGHDAQRLAFNYAECLNAQYSVYVHAVFEGQVVEASLPEPVAAE